ncbi:hypothetical protein TNCV_3132341 [Trichonephila clavipes]|nr:hypothetical protein TNCV_3132341 [Trichonephila clavipes]
MNSSKHRCINQASAPEAQTLQRSLNSSLGDTFGISLVLLGGQLLNVSPSIRPNASMQTSFTSKMLPPLSRKPMIIPFWTSDKSLHFCIAQTIAMFSESTESSAGIWVSRNPQSRIWL